VACFGAREGLDTVKACWGRRGVDLSACRGALPGSALTPADTNAPIVSPNSHIHTAYFQIKRRGDRKTSKSHNPSPYYPARDVATFAPHPLARCNPPALPPASAISISTALRCSALVLSFAAHGAVRRWHHATVDSGGADGVPAAKAGGKGAFGWARARGGPARGPRQRPTSFPDPYHALRLRWSTNRRCAPQFPGPGRSCPHAPLVPCGRDEGPAPVRRAAAQ